MGKSKIKKYTGLYTGARDFFLILRYSMTLQFPLVTRYFDNNKYCHILWNEFLSSVSQEIR